MRKEVHMTGRDLMNMVQLHPKDVGKYAIVPGPRERAEAVVKKMKNPVKNFSFMEYTMHTGHYEGIPLTTINGGRFAADTAITTEILCNAQVKAMIRVGSCGALREDIKVGDLVVTTTALKGEGVTQYYVDKDFVPTADAALTQSLVEAAQRAVRSPLAFGRRVHAGCCWTTDVILKETRENVEKAVAQGAIAVDMVTAAFLTICQSYKIPAAVIMAVSDNVITGEMGFLNPGYYMAEGSIVDIALSLVKELELQKAEK
jgi:uridine phosphorylase